MRNVNSISEMQKFHFGNKIICADGEDGVLAYVVFDPTARVLTHLGVKQGRLFGKTVQVPYSTVLSATSDGISLSLKLAEVATAPASTGGGAILDSKTTIEVTGTARRGTLFLMAVSPESGELAYLVAHHLYPGQDTLLQQEFITNLASGEAKVTISETALASLPPYRPDRVLQREVEAILYDVTPLHVDLKGMTIRVLDGVLYLDGNISSSLRADIVYDQVSGVPGLLEIKNRLVGDDTLASDLAMALGRDPRTRELPIGVYPRLGHVRLSGAVHNSQQKATAEEIARNMKGVRSVINDLVVDPKAEMLHIMSASEGGETGDIVPGQYVRHTK